MSMAHANGNGHHAMEGRAGSSEKDRRAAINMLPNADLSVHTCDSCSKDITGVRGERDNDEPRFLTQYFVEKQQQRRLSASSLETWCGRGDMHAVYQGL